MACARAVEAASTAPAARQRITARAPTTPPPLPLRTGERKLVATLRTGKRTPGFPEVFRPAGPSCCPAAHRRTPGVRHRELAPASRTRQNWRGMTRDVHPRILIVEDEKDIVQLLEFGLRQAGFETVSARDAGEAFARIREKAPDAVILDLMLPALPGTEVCRQPKSQAKTSALPVIMLTARTDEVDRVVGFELGADDYITKPFSVREVVLRVKAGLRRD